MFFQRKAVFPMDIFSKNGIMILCIEKNAREGGTACGKTGRIPDAGFGDAVWD